MLDDLLKRVVLALELVHQRFLFHSQCQHLLQHTLTTLVAFTVPVRYLLMDGMLEFYNRVFELFGTLLQLSTSKMSLLLLR